MRHGDDMRCIVRGVDQIVVDVAALIDASSGRAHVRLYLYDGRVRLAFGDSGQ